MSRIDPIGKVPSSPLPPYQVRVSPKAKHVSLRISDAGELEVVIPRGFDRKTIPEIVQKKRRWIETTTAKVKAERSRLQQGAQTLPQQVQFAAIGEDWQIEYATDTALQTPIQELADGRLVLQVDSHHPLLAQHSLRNWLAYKAEMNLIPWLRRVSEEINLSFSRASVRQQKTLWASCSNKKNISLNRNLLFLPPEVVRYVFVHELCHTQHMNHSPDFWALVSRHEPDYQRLDALLNKSQLYVPAWAEVPKLGLG